MQNIIRKPIVIGIGELLWDMLPQGKQLGGAPCNYVYHSLKLGCEAHIISSVGNDTLGLEAVRLVKDLGLDTSTIQITNKNGTGVVEVSLGDMGNVNYKIKENVAWDNIKWDSSMKEFAASADAICFGSLAQRNSVTQNTIFKFIEHSKISCLKIFDINLRQQYYSKDIIIQSLKKTDVLKLNETELQILANMLNYDMNSALDDLLNEYNIRLIAYTKGSYGSIIKTKNYISEMKAPKIMVEDTIGAGDSFTATLITGMLMNIDINIVHNTASKLSAYVCTQKGATPQVPEQLLKFKY
ncbi:MAG: PfkB family carbohydrate kinase [Anaerovoracaceae bacterium]